MALCPSCQSPLPPSGLCGRCVFARMNEMEREPARRLGDYDLLEELDHGGMGVVWRARHRELGRTVALKMIRGGHAAGESEIVRFRTESEAVARLEHPGIVPVYDLGEVDGVPYFTMPLLSGGSLQSRLAGETTLPAREAAGLMVQVARAVAHAHLRGVLHRDLKPANILLDAAGVPHVADFGLARIMESDSHLTRTGAVLGTPAYAAPEQIRGDVPTTSGDIFSLGAILYHLLCGRPPWDARDAIEVLRLSSLHDPPSVKLVNPSIHRDLHTITMRCLDRDPARRYATAAALAEDLERWLQGEPIHARAISPAERLWKWARRRPAAAALILLGTASLGAIFTQQVLSERRVRAESEIAQRAGDQAREAAARLRENLYASDMALAIRSVREGNLNVARRILTEYEAVPGAEDLRGFEWQWLKQETRDTGSIVLRGHTMPVTSVAFSPDGTQLATGGDDGIVRLWKMPGGEPAGTLPPPEMLGENTAQMLIDKVKLAPRIAKFPGIMQAVAADPELITLLTSRATPGYLAAIHTLSFSADGISLAVGSSTGTKVWRLADRTMQHVFPMTHCLATFHPAQDLLYIVSGYDPGSDYGDGTLTVWRLPDETQVAGDFGYSSLPVRFTGPEMIMTANKRGGVTRRAAADGRLLDHSRNTQGHVIRALAVSPDSSAGATADDRGPEVLVAQRDSAVLVPLSCGTASVRSLMWSPGGDLLAAGCDDHTIRLWGRDLRARPSLTGHEGAVNAVSFSPDGKWLASAGTDHTVRLWPMESRPALPRYEQISVRLIPHPGGGLLANVADVPVFWNGGRKFSLTGDSQPKALRWPLGFSPDGTRAGVLAYTGDNNSLMSGSAFLEWYATEDGRSLERLDLGRQRHFRAAALSPCGTRIVTARQSLLFEGGSRLLLRDAADGRILHEQTVDLAAPSLLSFTSDGKFVMAGTKSTRVEVLDAATLAPRWHRDGALSCEPVSLPGSDELLLGMGDHIHIVEAATGKDRAVLSGHNGRVEFLAIHPDGRTLASASADRTLRLWHLTTRRELGVIHSFPGLPCSGLTFSADGRQLIAGQLQGGAVVLGADP